MSGVRFVLAPTSRWQWDRSLPHESRCATQRARGDSGRATRPLRYEQGPRCGPNDTVEERCNWAW